MDKITLERIQTAHPKIREELMDAYIFINNKLLGKGVRLRFSWVYRFDYEQSRLFRKRPKVTSARAWQSYHNYGIAFDIVLLYDRDGNGSFETASWNTLFDGDGDGIADWLEVTQELEKRGWQNGFIRNGKKWDKPHFQKTFGMDWREMKGKIDIGDFFTEVISGKEYKYINL